MVFAGGTCLTKAHGLIDRMSEDIDFKVYLEEIPAGYSIEGQHSLASRLRNLHEKIEQRLKEIGFTFEDVSSFTENPLVRSSRRYYELSIDYSTAQQEGTTKIAALRPKLKLEIMVSPHSLSHEYKEISYLHRKLLGLSDSSSFELACIDLHTMLAEKVLAFLRRHAWLWSGNQRGSFDDALVRHIYDVSQLITSHPELLENTKNLFKYFVQQDVQQFGNQYPEFRNSPFSTLRDALQQAKTEQRLFIQKNFEKKLIPLLTTTDVVDFEVIFEKFCVVADALLNN